MVDGKDFLKLFMLTYKETGLQFLLALILLYLYLIILLAHAVCPVLKVMCKFFFVFFINISCIFWFNIYSDLNFLYQYQETDTIMTSLGIGHCLCMENVKNVQQIKSLNTQL